MGLCGRGSPCASRRAGLRGELSRVEKRALLARGASNRASSVPSGDGSRCFSRLLPSCPAEPSAACPVGIVAPRVSCPPFSFGPKVSFPAGGLSKLFPRMSGSRRTRRGPVRVGKCRARHGEPTGPETPAFPKSRADSESGEQKHSGVAGGGWKGVLRGAASPKQHPPSPVRRTHHLKRKSERTQSTPGASRPDTHAAPASTPGATAPRQNPRLASTPGASRHDTKALAAFRLSPAPAASATFAFRAPSKGRLSSKSAPGPSSPLPLCKGDSLRNPLPPGGHASPPLQGRAASGRSPARWSQEGGGASTLPTPLPPFPPSLSSPFLLRKSPQSYRLRSIIIL